VPDRGPHVIVLAGPNGAGKSTAAPHLLRGALGVTEFVNADMIAQGLSAFAPDTVALAAGRIMLARLRELAAKRADFAFETTLASRSFAPWLASLAATGYSVHLLFLWLPSADLAASRVADRVRFGGHDVPEEIIRRRYHAGLANFFDLYRPLADSWRLYDNGDESGPRLIAAGRGGVTTRVATPQLWNQISRARDNAR
jgi:predicted ABC-type ATPase